MADLVHPFEPTLGSVPAARRLIFSRCSQITSTAIIARNPDKAVQPNITAATVAATTAAIVTLDERRPTATAVAIQGDRIVAVGDLDDVIASLGDQPHAIDDTLGDRIVLPGLIDQHLHPILGATTLATEVVATEDWVLPDRTYPAAHSHDEYIARLTQAERAMADAGDWLFSWGYHRLWHGELNRDVLDTISDTRPIGVWQRSCHEFYFNTPALRRLGLFDRDLSAEVSDGTLDVGIASTADITTGHFWERGCFALAFPLVTPMLFHPERLERGLRQMVRYLHQNGVTAFNEPGAILVPGAWKMYEQILGDEDTPFFSYFLTDGRGPAEQAMSHEDTLIRAQRQYEMAPDQADGRRLAFFDKQVKLFADGAIISQLMQMREPYLDRAGNPNPDHHGEWIMPPEMFAERFRWYWDEDFQIHVHVNGDLGLDLVLDTLASALERRPRTDHRTVIVHFANSTEEQIDRIAELGAIVSSNPYYPVGFADKFGAAVVPFRPSDGSQRPDRDDVVCRQPRHTIRTRGGAGTAHRRDVGTAGCHDRRGPVVAQGRRARLDRGGQDRQLHRRRPEPARRRTRRPRHDRCDRHVLPRALVPGAHRRPRPRRGGVDPRARDAAAHRRWARPRRLCVRRRSPHHARHRLTHCPENVRPRADCPVLAVRFADSTFGGWTSTSQRRHSSSSMTSISSSPT